jgi:predicted nuclease of restriction endonuclease-like (RecB) superfamily
MEGNDQIGLFTRIVAILEDSRTDIVRSVNFQMVRAYWLIGKEIVEVEQIGENRAEYGKKLLENLSSRLTEYFGKGFSVTNLKYFRQFYLIYKNRNPEIGHSVRDQSLIGSNNDKIGHAVSDFFSPDLSWTHYRMLLKIENSEERSFYEIECVKNRWSSRQLERQINSLLFERLLKSLDKDEIMKLAKEGHQVVKPVDVIKDPYVLEFLDLPDSNTIIESDLEEALISHLQKFLLELGQGFAFVDRQKRLTLDGDHFYADLVFYHVKLKCYVVIDLKVAKLSHADLGQMQMYVHYFDREIRESGDNPTLGLILCTDKNEAMVEYVLDVGQEQIFASRYKTTLPDRDELRRHLLEWRDIQESGEEMG